MSTPTLTRRATRPSSEVPEIEIDPRIADRRSEVQRQHRRRRRRTLMILVAVTALTLGAVGLTRSAALDVDRIDVMGADRTPVDELIDASGLSLRAPMTELDLGGAADAIRELPWIADVRLERQWPNRVSIAVREREPVAAVPAAGDGWAIVDEAGHVLERRPDVSRRWPRIEGVDRAGEPGSRLTGEGTDALTVAVALTPDLRDGLDRIVVGDTGLELHFATGPRAVLGDVEHLDDKLDAVRTVFARVDDCGIDKIDVRVFDMPTVTRVPSCVASPEPSVTDTEPTDTGPTETTTAGTAASVEPEVSADG